jgi:hypothetical protein
MAIASEAASLPRLLAVGNNPENAKGACVIATAECLKHPAQPSLAKGPAVEVGRGLGEGAQEAAPQGLW